jgi:hypothetical protein
MVNSLFLLVGRDLLVIKNTVLYGSLHFLLLSPLLFDGEVMVGAQL